VAVAAISTEHQEAVTAAATSAAPVGATGGVQDNSSQILRCVVWFHHIKSTTKRKQLVAWARELDVRGYSKPGFPGKLVLLLLSMRMAVMALTHYLLSGGCLSLPA
jgi:hypothetical protein